MMEELMRFGGGVEEEIAQISDKAFEEDNKIPFLQMLHECIEPTSTEPNQIQSLEPESCVTLETIKRDPDPEKDPGQTEKRKRKRTRAPKDKGEVETQRMTHIAVERNRRRQMNEHLDSLRSLMPPSYLQRGDQASVVGGAIDFIKQLEQLLQSLEAEKDKEGTTKTAPSRACIDTATSSASTSSEDGFTARFGGGETMTEVEATVIQDHVSLKVRSKRGRGQILRAIVSIEELKLAILHLTISSSSYDFVFYSFSLKMEEGCKLGSADEIAAAVHHIFEANQNQR